MNADWLCVDGVLRKKPLVKRYYSYDSEERYQQNLQEKRLRLEQEGWIALPPMERCVGDRFEYNPHDPKINDWVELSYEINEHGFRGQSMPETKKPRSIITIGCSQTFGVGMPVGQIWPTLVGNTLRQRAYNLAMPSGSHDSAFRVLLSWLPRIRPSHVFFLEPPGVRYETITQTFGYVKSLPSHPKPIPFRFEHEDEWLLHREKTMRALKSLCDQFETPFIHMDQTFSDEYFLMMEKQDHARDLTHWGRKVHIWWAMNMLKKAGHEWSM